MDEKARRNLRDFGIFLAVSVVLVAGAAAAVVAARPSWRDAFGGDVQRALDSRWPGRWRVGGVVEIGSSMATSAAAYEIGGAGESGTAVVVRIPSLVGPVAAVFAVPAGAELAEFVGYAEDLGAAGAVLDSRITGGILRYWQAAVPEMIRGEDGE